MHQIIHHGAVDGVTGSCHELRLADGRSVLIDCGLFQGVEAAPEGATFEQLQIDFPIDHVQALVITHVHIDHVGRIPYLLAAGFRGPIYCSEPSAHLLPLVLEDALKVGFTRNRDLIERFLDHITQQLRPVRYGEWVTLLEAAPRCRLKLTPAGHILGSAFVTFAVHTRGRQERLLFSGDLGAPHTALLPAPRSPHRADVVVLESTYGDRLHEGRHERAERLRQAIERAHDNGGTVLIPAFSIGRTQELLYELEEIIYQQGCGRGRGRRRGHRHTATSRHTATGQSSQQGKQGKQGKQGQRSRRGQRWDELTIVIDSPLAARFNRIYQRLRPYWNKEARGRLRRGRHPLSFDQLVTVDDHDTHLRTVDALASSGRPAVVIAASGMCTGGRIVDYLKAMLGDERHHVLFVGHQASGTPGRDIQQYGPNGGHVVLDNVRYDIRAGVETIGGYSAHADRDDLVRFVKRMRHPPREVRLVHGEPGAQAELKAALLQALPAEQILTCHQ
ncbi:MBL fold hydrolase [Halorhodospira abdelmalekii]|uniref:MBL fold metallo-hydrolase RNA specificity domain-containing protein n=1 Tax=Halorhodospira abdelmalekii TaxID=421629 RepID=UPI00190742EE|nr:MBL fold metallo-hydrolase [Halorhodospira abdelmalekii]MBK1735834.1 MBL fold hydrolase [Halorhodospira abdelmalekii]